MPKDAVYARLKLGKVHLGRLSLHVIPYVAMLVLMMFAVAFLPSLATWLPGNMRWPAGVLPAGFILVPGRNKAGGVTHGGAAICNTGMRRMQRRRRDSGRPALQQRREG